MASLRTGLYCYMRLIKFEDYQLTIADEALLVRPIREIYNKDKSAKKEKFFQQMSILYFMTDPCSSYMYIIDEDERLKEILRQEGLPGDYVISKELKEAMELYRKHCETSSSMLLHDTRIAIDKLREFLRNVDLHAVDDKGKPIYQVNTITSTIKQIPELVKSLSDAEKAVQKELKEEGRIRGGADKKIFEDGLKI